MGGKTPGRWALPCNWSACERSPACCSLQPHVSTAAAHGELMVRQDSVQLFKPSMDAQSITEKGNDFKTISRSWSSQASPEVLMRPGLVSVNRGLWYKRDGQHGIEEGCRALNHSLRFIILLVLKSNSSGTFNTTGTTRAQEA